MLKIDRCPDKAEAFHRFVRDEKLKTWEDFNRFHDRKKALREELSIDQTFLDGYTEEPLSAAKNAVNIEHFRCWGKFNLPDECFNYYNFVVANKNNLYGGDHKDRVIKKDDYDVIFNPITESLAPFVEYDLGTGEMLPRKGLGEALRNRVMRTIEVFNLCDRNLNAKRREKLNDIVMTLNGLDVSSENKNEVRHYFDDIGYPTMIDWYFDTFH